MRWFEKPLISEWVSEWVPKASSRDASASKNDLTTCHCQIWRLRRENGVVGRRKLRQLFNRQCLRQGSMFERTHKDSLSSFPYLGFWGRKDPCKTPTHSVCSSWAADLKPHNLYTVLFTRCFKDSNIVISTSFLSKGGIIADSAIWIFVVLQSLCYDSQNVCLFVMRTS